MIRAWRRRPSGVAMRRSPRWRHDRVRRLPAPDRPDRGDRRPARRSSSSSGPRPGACSRCATRSCSRSARRRRSRRRYARSTRRAARARAARGRARDACAAAATRTPSGCATSPTRRRCCTCSATAGALGERGRRRRRRRAAGVVVRARGRPGARPRALGGAACRSSPGSRSGSTRRRTPARSRRRAARSACSRRARTSPYPARGWRLHAAVAARGAVISELPPGARGPPLVLHRPQPHHRRARRRDRRRPGHRALRLADDRGLRGRARPRRRRRPGPGHEPAVRRARTALIQAGAPLIRDAADALELLAGATGRVFAERADRPPPRRARRRRCARLLDAPSRTARGALTRAGRDAGGGAGRARRPGRARAPRPGPPRVRRALGAGGVIALPRLRVARRRLALDGARELADRRAASGDAWTQVSFAPPFWDELTTSAPSERATRVRPPGQHARRAPSPRNTNGPQVDVTRREAAALDDGRVGGEHDHALGDPGAGVGDHGGAGGLDLLARRARGDQHADAAVAGARLQDQLVEDVQRLLELRRAGRGRRSGRSAGRAPRRRRSGSCPRRRRG